MATDCAGRWDGDSAPPPSPSSSRPPTRRRRTRRDRSKTSFAALALSFLTVGTSLASARPADAANLSGTKYAARDVLPPAGATWPQPRSGPDGSPIPAGNAFVERGAGAAPPLDPLRPRFEDSGKHVYDRRLMDKLSSRAPDAGQLVEPRGPRQDGEGSLPIGKRFTTTQSTSFPPSDWIDINNLTTIDMVTTAAINRFQTWVEPSQWIQWTPWWQFPIAGIAYADIDLATATKTNEALVTNLLNGNEGGVSWMIDKYIDDQLWWGLYALKGYQLYGNDTWLQNAGKIQRNSSYYWDSTCGGGVLWLTYKPEIKNTITNALYFSLTARLYRMTGQSYYYNETMRTLNWWLNWAFDPTTGRVYDTIQAPDCEPTGLQIYTYNSGVALSGLVDVYLATGNTTILDLARTIAYAGLRDYSTPDAGIAQESCEHDTTPTENTPSGCGQDQIAFKGIFLAGLSYLYAARPTDINLYNYINTQFLSNTFNNLDSSWLFGEWWSGPWNETTAGPKTQIAALSMLAATTVTDAAFNAQFPA